MGYKPSDSAEPHKDMCEMRAPVLSMEKTTNEVGGPDGDGISVGSSTEGYEGHINEDRCTRRPRLAGIMERKVYHLKKGPCGSELDRAGRSWNVRAGAGISAGRSWTVWARAGPCGPELEFNGGGKCPWEKCGCDGCLQVVSYRRQHVHDGRAITAAEESREIVLGLRLVSRRRNDPASNMPVCTDTQRAYNSCLMDPLTGDSLQKQDESNDPDSREDDQPAQPPVVTNRLGIYDVCKDLQTAYEQATTLEQKASIKKDQTLHWQPTNLPPEVGRTNAVKSTGEDGRESASPIVQSPFKSPFSSSSQLPPKVGRTAVKEVTRWRQKRIVLLVISGGKSQGVVHLDLDLHSGTLGGKSPAVSIRTEWHLIMRTMIPTFLEMNQRPAVKWMTLHNTLRLQVCYNTPFTCEFTQLGNLNAHMRKVH
uniref:Uncharacterized protein n=1 Tax=Branchiostoma floridae TaxID=7739 RepID=C3XT22_BRAFL|eukprot:XP_002612746.1 hypothetical protein BRAFLDRAFT_97274 [Branchiostoma floridae]